ncbi:pentatricopeptide repeat domain containing protein [Acanthamoeba castellanii str. Neff]|uniref:Pentatricopeptide repeat domain containing protein n=1 Tax=Acanthamoeba castellanii (strain ATCC 30010 / Neff) TaxID=1257118 RepID=L8GPX6_ACACF|nr:pentatricopeptide repeat domain containing protein [Acanthamoeba castellanii str. Neff]ELR14161.1 pentatricopeptide repeat domain containing protein [Acanthamoeba castellanii str. Neff]
MARSLASSARQSPSADAATTTSQQTLWVDRFRFRCRPTPTLRPLSSAYVALAKVVLRSGSKRKRAQVAAAADGADAAAAQAWAQRRLLLPSLAPGRTVPADLSVEAVEEEIAAFKRDTGLNARAEVPLYCVTIRELGRRGCGHLADAIARHHLNIATATTTTGAELRQQRIYSALLEGHCLRRRADDAAALYLELVERRNVLPSHRALHMLIDLLARRSRAHSDGPTTLVMTSAAARMVVLTSATLVKVAELFEEMKARGHVTTAAYNALLPVVGRKGGRRLPSLKNLLDEMVAHDVPRNELTWKALLESASGPEEFEQMKKLMGTHGWKPESSANTLLRLLPKYASTAELMVFLAANAHRVHAGTFNSLIRSYSHAGNFEGAFAMALNMRKAHFLPSKRAFLSFLKCGGYVLQASDIELMWSDLTRKLARSGRKINRDYYHAKMISYLRRKDPEAVRRTLEEMEDNGLTPNSYTYYLLILVDDVDGFF